MVPLVMIMLQELADRVPQRPGSEEDHAIKAAFFDGTHKSPTVQTHPRETWRPMDGVSF